MDPTLNNNIKRIYSKKLGIPIKNVQVIQQKLQSQVNPKKLENIARSIFEKLLQKSDAKHLLNDPISVGARLTKNQTKNFYAGMSGVAKPNNNPPKNLNEPGQHPHNRTPLTPKEEQTVYNMSKKLLGTSEFENQRTKRTREGGMTNTRAAQKRAMERAMEQRVTQSMTPFMNYKMTKAQLVQKILIKVRSLKKDKLKRLLSKLT
jgi:hypothetical protein